MNKLKLYFVFIGFTFTVFCTAQNHYFGIKAGYTKSMIIKPDNRVNNSGNNIEFSRGSTTFKSLDGFQIGITSHLDVGSDFSHVDLALQYSKYGFQDNQNFVYDYLDLDIGISNFASEVLSKVVFGIGVTPSLVLSSKDIENINNFDFKIYLIFGYRFSKNYVIYSQIRVGVIEPIPETKIKNVQFSFNINIPILKIKK